MKRILILGAVVAAAGVAVALLEQHFERDRLYRTLLAAGERRLAAAEWSAAIESLSGALALRPTSMVAYLRRGEAYRGESRTDEAARDLRQAAQLAPDSTAPAIALGDLYDSTGDPARAAEWYGQAAARLKDQDPGLLYRLALSLYRAGSPAAAIDPLQRALARNDSVGEAHYLLGLAYRDTRRLDEAVQSLERAVKVAPTLLPAREELADLYRALGRPGDEMAQLQALAALDDQVDRTVAIALSETRRAQFDAALATLTQVQHAGTRDVPWHLAIGRVYLARAERTLDRSAASQALDALQPMSVESADRSQWLALIGRAWYLSGDWARAERTLRAAVSALPVDSEAFGYLADAAERLTHDGDARDALANLDALQGETAPAEVRAARARRIGVLSLRLGDPAGAAAAFARAIDSGARDGSTFGLLAQAQWQAGRHADGAATLARGLAVDPRNPDLLRLSRTIK